MDQSETVEFLATPGRAFRSGAPVEVIETHTALVFLCGDTVLKLKRAVKYDYVDQSTEARRRALVERELELNAPAAPEIYRDVVPVTAEPGGLALGGGGPAVDWVLRMRRFPAADQFDAIVERHAFDDRLAGATGAAIAAYHAACPVRRQPGRALIGAILGELGRVFGEFRGAEGTGRVGEWEAAAGRALDAVGAQLDSRGEAGHVRRAHGDLHLRNLVLLDGRPTLFDALEFDETLGTCDVLYDIGFLIMDLCHRDLRQQACRVLDAWLREARGAEDAGLSALPLFLSVRAAIRAMVLLQTDAARGHKAESAPEVAAYLDLACGALAPTPPVLVAVGGLSGSGKSVLARALAPRVGSLPGAVLLSSDLERKAGLRADDRLGAESYAPDRREAVYHAMFERAEAILGAGHSAILDATFLDPDLRRAAGQVAARAGVPFRGLWLEAPREVLEARIAARAGDASDADVAVLRQQLDRDHGAVAWDRLDASGDPETVLRTGAAAVSGAWEMTVEE